MVNHLSKRVLKQIVDHFKEFQPGEWGIDHKRLWLEYLKTGELPFSSGDLQHTINKIISKPENLPRGAKLLNFHKKTNFTLKDDKTPYRPEEALERFIIITNEDNLFNQFPIGGRKESVDLVIQHSQDVVEFIELKPWNTNDSPLYALVEGLKNLVEYRVMVDHQIKVITKPWQVNLSVLAPNAYWNSFSLLDGSYIKISKNILRTNKLLNLLAAEFQTNISLYTLDLSHEIFNEICAHVYEQNNLSGQQVVALSPGDCISSLERSQWQLLASSCG